MQFSKMQGTGNDFIILNNQTLHLPAKQFPSIARRICTPRLSLGSDALMVVEAPVAGGDLRMCFFNADGTEAEMCGNGARCLARYAYENGLAGEHMVIETMAGLVEAWRIDRRQYKIALNAPTRAAFDFDADGIKCAYIELGDPAIPHAVVYMPGLATANRDALREKARMLRRSKAFPKGANVNFYDLLGGNDVLELTFERGVEDFTLACGTGSGSVALALVRKGLVPGPTVHLKVPGGDLWVETEGKQLCLIGDTNIVAVGDLTDEDLMI